MRSKAVALILLVGLTGCATVASRQVSCEQRTTTFPDIAQCLKAAVGQPRIPETKLYLLTAEQLSEKVQRHEMSDTDARVELQRTYMRAYRDGGDDSTGKILLRAFAAGMQGAARARAESNAAMQRDAQPSSTDCQRVGNNIYCTTYGDGAPQMTQCQVVGNNLFCN